MSEQDPTWTGRKRTLMKTLILPNAKPIHVGYLSWRSHVWTDVDPDRTGTLPFVWKPDFGIKDYVEYALDVPMYFAYRNGVYIQEGATTHSFRDFIAGKLPALPGSFHLPAPSFLLSEKGKCKILMFFWPESIFVRLCCVVYYLHKLRELELEFMVKE